MDLVGWLVDRKEERCGGEFSSSSSLASWNFRYMMLLPLHQYFVRMWSRGFFLPSFGKKVCVVKSKTIKYSCTDSGLFNIKLGQTNRATHHTRFTQLAATTRNLLPSINFCTQKKKTRRWVQALGLILPTSTTLFITNADHSSNNNNFFKANKKQIINSAHFMQWMNVREKEREMEAKNKKIKT